MHPSSGTPAESTDAYAAYMRMDLSRLGQLRLADMERVLRDESWVNEPLWKAHEDKTRAAQAERHAALVACVRAARPLDAASILDALRAHWPRPRGTAC